MLGIYSSSFKGLVVFDIIMSNRPEVYGLEIWNATNKGPYVKKFCIRRLYCKRAKRYLSLSVLLFCIVTAAALLTREIVASSLSTAPKLTDDTRPKQQTNATLHRTPAAVTGDDAGRVPRRRRLVLGLAARGGGARAAGLRLDPEAGALQLEPQHPRRVLQAGEASRPAHQRPDHRYPAPLTPSNSSSAPWFWMDLFSP